MPENGVNLWRRFLEHVSLQTIKLTDYDKGLMLISPLLWRIVKHKPTALTTKYTVSGKKEATVF